MSDLLLRGRGAEVGARAPVWLVRLCGAALALAVFTLTDTLGIWQVLGVPTWGGRVGAMLIGAVAAPSRFGSWLWPPIGALTIALAAIAFTPLVQPLVRPLVRVDAVRPDNDAVVVLSGGMNDDGRIHGPALDRLLSGIAESRRRGIPIIALSVIERTRRGRSITSESDQRTLTTLIAPGLNVRFVRDVHDTHDEALAFAAMARTHGWHRVLLITSPTHTQRACGAFEVAGLPVECHAAEERDYSMARLDLPENRRHAFADAMYEWAGLLVYRWRRWIA